MGLCFFASFSTDAEIIRGEIWNGIGSTRYNDGVYKGQYRNGRFHGKGIFYRQQWPCFRRHVERRSFLVQKKKVGAHKTQDWEFGSRNRTGVIKVTKKRIAAAL